MTFHDDETKDRFAIATAELLRQELAPEFANDNSSVVFVHGPPLDADTGLSWAEIAKETQLDVVYLAFAPGRERFGPMSLNIFAERWGIVFRWLDCVLWAPKDGGSLLAMPQGLNVCFSHDGKALISHEARPAQSLRNGVSRARIRLLRAARAVTPEQLAQAQIERKRAA